MSTDHYDYNEDSFSSGIENIVAQTQWSIHFSHVPTGNCVFFEAFLTDFQDSFRSVWSQDSVFGRMDPIATFQNTERNIQFGFNVVAETDIAAANNLHRFQHLSSFLYPTYEETESPHALVTNPGKTLTMNQSPLIRIKFANLIHDASVSGFKEGRRKKPDEQTTNPNEAGLVGFVQGFNFTPKLENGFFTGGPGVFYPMEYQVNVDFTVLHNHDLGWGTNGFLGPRSFPNGDGMRAIKKTKDSECMESGKPMDTQFGKAVNSQESASGQDKTAKGKNVQAMVDKTLNTPLTLTTNFGRR